MTAEQAKELQDRLDFALADFDPEERRLIQALMFAIYRWRSHAPPPGESEK